MSCNPFTPIEGEWNNAYDRKIVSISDIGAGKSKYIANNPKAKRLNLFRVDGKLISTGERCDFLLLLCANQQDNNVGEARFIELKGCDLAKACDQIIGTIETLKPKLGGATLKARIVLSKTPVPDLRGTSYRRLQHLVNNDIIQRTRELAENI